MLTNWFKLCILSYCTELLMQEDLSDGNNWWDAWTVGWLWWKASWYILVPHGLTYTAHQNTSLKKLALTELRDPCPQTASFSADKSQKATLLWTVHWIARVRMRWVHPGWTQVSSHMGLGTFFRAQPVQTSAVVCLNNIFKIKNILGLYLLKIFVKDVLSILFRHFSASVNKIRFLPSRNIHCSGVYNLVEFTLLKFAK